MPARHTQHDWHSNNKLTRNPRISTLGSIIPLCRTLKNIHIFIYKKGVFLLDVGMPHNKIKKSYTVLPGIWLSKTKKKQQICVCGTWVWLQRTPIASRWTLQSPSFWPWRLQNWKETRHVCFKGMEMVKSKSCVKVKMWWKSSNWLKQPLKMGVWGYLTVSGQIMIFHQSAQ